MHQLSKERILEFQKTFKKECDKELTFTEATEAVNNLVGFFDLLFKIDRRVNPQLYKKDKNKLEVLNN